MSYLALYNKYRPMTFDDVVGQDKTVTILRRAVKSGRVANGYLFIGNRGLGKTTLARILAKALNCTSDTPPCNECEACMAVNDDKSMDVIELDAASNRGVDTVRDVIINKVGYKPRGNYKVYIIDECHMFTIESWNAMLKTLESPPEYCVFVFCTTNPEKIPKTILSRVQTFKLDDIGNDDIVGRLVHICKKEHFKYTSDALYAIARYSKGGMRDSISALDQLSSFGETIDIELVSSVLGLADDDVCCGLFGAICSKDLLECVRILDDINKSGKSVQDVFDVICAYTRVYIKLMSKCDVSGSDISDTAVEFIRGLVGKDSLDYRSFIKLIVDGERALRFSNDKMLSFIGIVEKYINFTPVQQLPVQKSEPKSNDADAKASLCKKLDASDTPEDVAVPLDKALGVWLKEGAK